MSLETITPVTTSTSISPVESSSETSAPTESSSTESAQPATKPTVEVAPPVTNNLFELKPSYSVFTDEKWLSSFFPRTHERESSSLVTGSDSNGRAWVKTADGYLIRFDNNEARWKITGPDGKTTTIWGDPHVQESDGDRWDFTASSTFVFGDNRITVETVPSESGVNVTGKVHIYNGKDRVSFADIDKNALRFIAWKSDAKAHDAAMPDGDVYVLERESNGDDIWVKR